MSSRRGPGPRQHKFADDQIDDGSVHEPPHVYLGDDDLTSCAGPRAGRGRHEGPPQPRVVGVRRESRFARPATRWRARLRWRCGGATVRDLADRRAPGSHMMLGKLMLGTLIFGTSMMSRGSWRKSPLVGRPVFCRTLAVTFSRLRGLRRRKH